MPANLAELRQELSVANRILANEGVVDAFGHISVRHPDDPNRYLISRHRAAELVEPGDILEFTLDSKPVKPTDLRLYSELVIHGCIYQLRPDVNSVCHHHAISVLPFCIAGIELVPVMHLGATMGRKVPFWDSRDEFGDTPLLVTTPEQGMSMAKALGEHWTVLLRRHGATVAGRSIRENVFRSIYGCRNAELQARALAMGKLGPLSKGEVEQCSGHSLTPRTLIRAWEYWTRRLEKAENATAPRGRSPAAAAVKATLKAKETPKPAKLTPPTGRKVAAKRR
jgi:HCOMODA/2-hydroxy-3-carboxy-muconic semialdehyde decarboxylase